MLMSDAQTIEALRFILDSGEQDTIKAMKSNVYSYRCLVDTLQKKRQEEAQKRRECLTVITGGVGRQRS